MNSLLLWARKTVDIIPKGIPKGIAKIEPVNAKGNFFLLKVKLAPITAIIPITSGIAPKPEAVETDIPRVLARCIKPTISSYKPGISMRLEPKTSIDIPPPMPIQPAIIAEMPETIGFQVFTKVRP